MVKTTKKSNKPKKFRTKSFKNWSFGTINIQSGHEKNEKIYSVTKEIVKANLAFCCLQEVCWRGTGSKIIALDTGKKFEFHWAGYRKKRQAGTGILIRVDPNIEISSPNINAARVMGIDLKINGFNIRIVNAYAPTEATGTVPQKQSFYSLLSKAMQKLKSIKNLSFLVTSMQQPASPNNDVFLTVKRSSMTLNATIMAIV